MARRRSPDYEAKRTNLLRTAATLFARHGYDRTSLAMIARAAGVSKALVYHYYDDKNAVLADIIRRHLKHLIEAVTAAAAQAGRNPEQRLIAMAIALLEAYRDADAEHKVQVAHLDLLPPPLQHELKNMERELVARFADTLAAIAPPLRQDRRLFKPLTMSLFGMLNWAFLWFREDGPLTRREYAELAAGLIIRGAAETIAKREQLSATAAAAAGQTAPLVQTAS